MVDSDDHHEHKPTPSIDRNIDHAASLRYWNGVPATADSMLAMLGRYSWYSRIDLQGSKLFLSKVNRLLPSSSSEGKFKLGVDCGAGVGRVTDGFLKNVCEVVDIVEPVEKFTEALRSGSLGKDGVIGDIYSLGLENWNPEKKYHLIWTQWCVGYLTDVQLTEYISRCRAALANPGIMVVKENISTEPHGEDMYDPEDNSVTRTDKKFRRIFRDAGMALIKTELQTGFPKHFKLLPVRLYALRPEG